MNTDKQSTALQQLIKYMNETNNYGSFGSIAAKATELLEVERKQIEDAGKYFANYNGIDDSDIEDYFTTTFKQ